VRWFARAGCLRGRVEGMPTFQTTLSETSPSAGMKTSGGFSSAPGQARRKEILPAASSGSLLPQSSSLAWDLLDHRALEEEIQRLHPASFAWAMACCRWIRPDAEEVLQMTYFKVLEGRARYSGRATVKTWLFSVIHNTAADWRRRHLLETLALHR